MCLLMRKSHQCFINNINQFFMQVEREFTVNDIQYKGEFEFSISSYVYGDHPDIGGGETRYDADLDTYDIYKQKLVVDENDDEVEEEWETLSLEEEMVVFQAMDSKVWDAIVEEAIDKFKED